MFLCVMIRKASFFLKSIFTKEKHSLEDISWCANKETILEKQDMQVPLFLLLLSACAKRSWDSLPSSSKKNLSKQR